MWWRGSTIRRPPMTRPAAFSSSSRPIPKAIWRRCKCAISAGEITGKTVAEIFAAKGLFRETPELIAAYDANRHYFDWRARYGAQFSGGGPGFFAEDPSARTAATTGRARKRSSCRRAAIRRGWSMTKACSAIAP